MHELKTRAGDELIAQNIIALNKISNLKIEGLHHFSWRLRTFLLPCKLIECVLFEEGLISSI